jgi:uncharacterized Fe-S center protein
MMQQRFYDLNTYFREKFGCRVQKITIDAGLTCPNRDGTISSKGCIFCNDRGSGTGAHQIGLSITEQLVNGKKALSKRYKANKFNDEGKYKIFYHHCTYCQHCVEICPNNALTFSSKGFVDFQKGMALATKEVLDTFDKDKIYYINVLLSLTMLCDCWGFSTPSLVPDIGIMASNDMAAIDKASLDMIKAENLLPDSLPKGRELREGKHLFEKIFGKDPYNQIKIL